MPLPLLPAAAPAIISAGKGVYDMISGHSKYKKAKAEMDALATPFYKIQNEYNQNRDIAANRAGQGYSSSQLDYLTNENERGIGAGISALTQGGGTNANDVAKILDTYNRIAERTAADDASLQTQNIAQFFGANKDLAGQKTIQWHENEYQPWANKQALLAQQMGVAKKTQDQGWNNIISGISGALSAFSDNDLQKAMLQKPPQQYAAQNSTPQQTVNAYNPSSFTSLAPAPQTFNGSNATYQVLMNGGRILGTDNIPAQGAARPWQYTPIEFNFDVSKMWGG